MFFQFEEEFCRYCGGDSESYPLTNSCYCEDKYHEKCLLEHLEKKLEKPVIPLFVYQYEPRCEKCGCFFTVQRQYKEVQLSSPWKIYPLYIGVLLVFHLLLYTGIGAAIYGGNMGLIIEVSDPYANVFLNGALVTQICIDIIYFFVVLSLTTATQTPSYCALSGNNIWKHIAYITILLIGCVLFPIYIDVITRLSQRREYQRMSITKLV